MIKAVIEQLKNEINIHINLMKTKQKQYFIKMYGYFNTQIHPVDNLNSYYVYNEIINNKISRKVICQNQNDPGVSSESICDMYLFLEKGESDLKHVLDELNVLNKLKEIIKKYPDIMTESWARDEFIKKIKEVDGFSDKLAEKFVDNFNQFKKFYELHIDKIPELELITSKFYELHIDDKIPELELITSKFYKLLNFYKVSRKKKTFIHGDIKIENIVKVKNKTDYDLKLIDFGQSIFQNEFEYTTPSSGTPIYYNYYNQDKTPSNRKLTPYYDVFCLILSYIQILIGEPIGESIDTKKYYSYDELINKINKEIIKKFTDENKLCLTKLLYIGWLFVIDKERDITTKTIIFTNKKKLYNSINNQKISKYKLMDYIIKNVCNYKKISDIQRIQCNGSNFKSIITLL